MAKIYAHNFEFWGSPRLPPPKGKKISPGPMCATVQNFTLIGAIVAEIIVIGQRKKTTNTPFHANVWRVINWRIII